MRLRRHGPDYMITGNASQVEIEFVRPTPVPDRIPTLRAMVSAYDATTGRTVTKLWYVRGSMTSDYSIESYARLAAESERSQIAFYDPEESI